MKITVKLGLLFAGIWILAKLGIYYGFQTPETFAVQPTALLNILLLLCAVSFGLFFTMRSETEESNFLNDVKNGMSAGLPYTLIVSIFIYFFYGQIAPEVNKHQLSEIQTRIKMDLEIPEKVEEFKKSNEQFEVMTKDEMFEAMSSNAKAMFAPGSSMTLAMGGLLLLALINSILVAIILRRIVFRR